MNKPTRRQFIKATSLLVAVPYVSRGAERKPRIRIGQIGTGHGHAQGKMNVYRASKDFEVVGLAEPDPNRRRRLASHSSYRDIPLMTTEQLLNQKGLQAVAVETEVKDLLKHAELCLDAGKHIHLDKPAGSHFPTFQRLMKKADQARLTVQLGYMYRYNPAVLFLMDCLKKGWLGEPFALHAVMGKVISAQERRTIDGFTGGIMFELGCHVLDLAVGILGKPDSVSAFPRQTTRQGQDTLNDNMLAVLEYPKATASIRAAAVEVDGFARRHLVVCGTGGTCHIQPLDRPAIRLALNTNRGKYRKGYQDIPFEPPYKRYVGDAIDLARIIRGEKPNDFPSSHELDVQETVLRASGMPTN